LGGSTGGTRRVVTEGIEGLPAIIGLGLIVVGAPINDCLEGVSNCVRRWILSLVQRVGE
jgi:hypothetical protein